MLTPGALYPIIQHYMYIPLALHSDSDFQASWGPGQVLINYRLTDTEGVISHLGLKLGSWVVPGVLEQSQHPLGSVKGSAGMGAHPRAIECPL